MRLLCNDLGITDRSSTLTLNKTEVLINSLVPWTRYFVPDNPFFSCSPTLSMLVHSRVSYPSKHSSYLYPNNIATNVLSRRREDRRHTSLRPRRHDVAHRVGTYARTKKRGRQVPDTKLIIETLTLLFPVMTSHVRQKVPSTTDTLP